MISPRGLKFKFSNKRVSAEDHERKKQAKKVARKEPNPPTQNAVRIRAFNTEHYKSYTNIRTRDFPLMKQQPTVSKHTKSIKCINKDADIVS